MHTKTELLDLLQANRLTLKKRLGQHYLIDPHTTRRLVSSCELSPEDTVVEIGAGLGALTNALADAVRAVVAVELDPGICALLSSRLAGYSNVRVVCEDILSFAWSAYPGAKVVGAIPYQITSPILVSLCEHTPQVASVWLGMQQEVATRLTARPGTKAFGRLTVLVQYRFVVEQLMRIPKAAFFPQPKVDSAWVRLTPRRSPAVAVRDESVFFAVVRAAFGQRRKTLLNCLRHVTGPGLSREAAVEALRAADLPPAVRGEELSLEAFARLADILADKRLA